MNKSGFDNNKNKSPCYYGLQLRKQMLILYSNQLHYEKLVFISLTQKAVLLIPNNRAIFYFHVIYFK